MLTRALSRASCTALRDSQTPLSPSHVITHLLPHWTPPLKTVCEEGNCQEAALTATAHQEGRGCGARPEACPALVPLNACCPPITQREGGMRLSLLHCKVAPTPPSASEAPLSIPLPSSPSQEGLRAGQQAWSRDLGPGRLGDHLIRLEETGPRGKVPRGGQACSQGSRLCEDKGIIL